MFSCCGNYRILGRLLLSSFILRVDQLRRGSYLKKQTSSKLNWHSEWDDTRKGTQFFIPRDSTWCAEKYRGRDSLWINETRHPRLDWGVEKV